MNEEQWTSCTDPAVMLGCLRDGEKVSNRHLLLFTVAWLRMSRVKMR